jgi:hypothetical protein
MRLRLDDNTRSALHFALLGGAVVLAVRLLAWGGEAVRQLRHPDALSVALRPFQRGYLLADPTVLVDEPTDLPERLAFAFLFSLLLAMFAGLLLGGVLQLAGRGGMRATDAGVRAGRVVLLVATVWTVAVALFLPIRWTRTSEGAVVCMERPSLFGRLALPLQGVEQRASLPTGQVFARDGGLWMHSGTDQVPLARSGDEVAAQEAARLLNAHIGGGMDGARGINKPND